jgi:hypothetical protein
MRKARFVERTSSGCGAANPIGGIRRDQPA